MDNILKFNLFISGCAGSSLLYGLFCIGDEHGLLFIAVHRLLTRVASLVAEHRLTGAPASVVVARGLNSCSSWALEHRLNSCGAWA